MLKIVFVFSPQLGTSQVHVQQTTSALSFGMVPAV